MFCFGETVLFDNFFFMSTKLAQMLGHATEEDERAQGREEELEGSLEEEEEEEEEDSDEDF